MAKKGGDEQVSMPIANKPRKRDPLEESASPTWAGLEASKSRLAAAMDRCEFLASSRNRFTDLAAEQATSLGRSLHKKDWSMHFHKNLERSVPDMRIMLDKQADTMHNGKTVWKRVDQLNTYVINKEEKSNGDLGKTAAKKSSKQATPVGLKDIFSDPYEQFAHKTMSPSGADREWPVSAVKTGMPYIPPMSALTHGRKKDFGASTTNSTMSSRASTRGKQG